MAKQCWVSSPEKKGLAAWSLKLGQGQVLVQCKHPVVTVQQTKKPALAGLGRYQRESYFTSWAQLSTPGTMMVIIQENATPLPGPKINLKPSIEN